MIRFFYILLISILLAGNILTPAKILAEEAKEVKALVTVKAMVPTKVVFQNSSFTANVNEILADSSQKIILTAQLRDIDNNPLENISVKLTSNRGAIDEISRVEPSSQTLTPDDSIGVKGISDSNGFVFFEISSDVPGDALFNLRVEDQLNLNQIKIKFLPLPFPKNIVVVVEVPKAISPTGGITILKPTEQDFAKDRLVNLTMEVRVPIWITYLLLFIITVNILLFIIIIAFFFKLRKIQKLEQKDIEIDEAILRQEVNNNDSHSNPIDLNK